MTCNWKEKGIHGVTKMILLRDAEGREPDYMEEVQLPSGFTVSIG